MHRITSSWFGLLAQTNQALLSYGIDELVPACVVRIKRLIVRRVAAAGHSMAKYTNQIASMTPRRSRMCSAFQKRPTSAVIDPWSGTFSKELCRVLFQHPQIENHRCGHNMRFVTSVGRLQQTESFPWAVESSLHQCASRAWGDLTKDLTPFVSSLSERTQGSDSQ